MRYNVAILVCLLAGGVPAAAAAQDTPTTDIVVTSYGWPVGTSGTVETYQRMVRAGDGTDSDIVVQGTYDFTVEAHEEGLFVRHSNFRTTNFTSVPELPPDNPLSLLYSRLGTVQPHYVVSHGGELLRVEDVEAMRDRMREVLVPLLDSLGQQAAAADQLLQQVTSSEYLFSQLAEQWNVMVGFWIDADLELGAVYEFEDRAPSPLIPTELIPFQYQFSAAERLPCSPSASRLDCVRFEFRSVPDPAVVATMLTTWMERLGALGPDARIDSMEQENLVSVVADPTTLLPYRYEMSRVLNLIGTEDGETTEAGRSDETVYVFRYR